MNPDHPAAMTPARVERLARIARQRWWHTLDLGGGDVTPGERDLRHLPARMPWPGSLAGKRCLDVGTADGFWAFEMERRGAAEVAVIDVPDVAQDHRPGWPPPGRDPAAERRPGEAFQVAAEALNSKAWFQLLNVYDLRPELVGWFDVVFVGYLLPQLRDPLRALAAVRSVCRGSVIVLDQVLFWQSLFNWSPVAYVGHRRQAQDWWFFNAAGLRRVVELAGFQVAGDSGFVHFRAGPGVTPDAGTKLRLWLTGGTASLAVRGDATA
ncbi:MAG: methyltransferase domain-containing protein [Anaerolineales bacterium]|nr:methyltransferase domain-containing protein [Anaerolineales bacterium]